MIRYPSHLTRHLHVICSSGVILWYSTHHTVPEQSPCSHLH